MELWTTLFERPDKIAELAERREDEGWDGVTFADTQFYFPDPYVLMTAVALRTSRIGLSHSTTNPLTRHPTVTAAAAASLQIVSGGRLTLGIGRGDSAAFYAGSAPSGGHHFEASLETIRRLLDGRAVDLPPAPDTVAAAHHETEAGFPWLTPGMPRVPIDVYGSGPRTLRIAAKLADRLVVALGAEPERLASARHLLHAAAASVGRVPPRFGAVILTAAHPDPGTARRLIAGFATSHARFAAMSGTPVGTISDGDRDAYESAARGYDMARHGESGSTAVTSLNDDFLDRFAVAGPVEHCVERILELEALGVDHLLLMPPGIDNSPVDRELAVRLLGQEVLPRVRQAGGLSL